MEEIVKHINDTNASYRALGAGDAKNTDLFLDNEHYELFKESGEQITVRYNRENLTKAILFIASILPRKYDNSAIHKTINFSTAFVLDQLAFLDGFFTVDGAKVESRTQKWNARKDVLKSNGEIDKRFYFNGLLEEIAYTNYRGERKSAKFTIRNYIAGGYSDLHIKKASDGIFDVWVTNILEPYNDGKEANLEKIETVCCTAKSLQKIYYGAPGTGKSHEIKRLTKGKEVIRTTFHPDSDYSTFVGAYKPVMEDVDVQVVPVVLNNGASFDQNKGTFKEKRITYKFVKQAFLKAYLGAWKKYINNESANQERPLFEVSSGIDTWIINKVDDNKAYYKKITHQDIGWYEQAVKKAWNEGLNTDNYHPFTACNWYLNTSQDEEKNADKCWEAVWDELSAGRSISSAPGGSQEYVIVLEGNSIVITAEGKDEGKGASKDAIKTQFEKKDNNSDTSVRKAIAQKLREYSEDFDKAWEKFKENVEAIKGSVTSTSDAKAISPQFLVIEEINRGNCAQIFGDLFQLLDRGENGFSEYPIEADTDLQREIARAFKEETEYKLARNIEVDGVIKGYKSNYGRTLSEDIQEGRILLLPPNLYIWATMNTSDQSLFPIDSAFKRRWEWFYMPIGYKNDNWIIEIGEKQYNWVDFQRKINENIYAVDNSEDKQLGDYFVNADRTGNKISADIILNKILFYIWNDVSKDDPDQIFRWIDDKQEKSIKFSEFFGADRDKKLQGFMAYHKIPAIGDAVNTNNSEATQDSEEGEMNETPAENGNDVNS